MSDGNDNAKEPLWHRLGRALLSLTFLAGALYLLDTDQVMRAVEAIHPGYLMIAFGLLMAEAPVLGFRWYLLVRDAVDLSAYEVLRRYAIAVFFSTFTPAQLGTDVYRFADLRKEGANRRQLLALLVQERVLGLISYLLFFLACGAVLFIDGMAGSDESELLIAAVVGFFVFILIGLMVGRPVATALQQLNARTFDIVLIDKLLDVCKTALNFGSPGHLGRVLALSLVGGSALWVTTVFVVSEGLQVGAPFALIGLIAVVVEIIRLIPITVQGLGVREASFAYCFKVFGLSPELGFVVALVAYIAYNVTIILVGVIGYLLPRRDARKSGAEHGKP